MPTAASSDDGTFPLVRGLTTQILVCVYLGILLTGTVLLPTKFLAQLILH